MRPAHLSATGCQVFESCPARFKAEYLDRSRDASGEAADLGTTCHKTLELWVKRGLHKPKGTLEQLKAIYEEAFDSEGLTDRSRFNEGFKMCKDWWERTDLDDGRTTLSTEHFEDFTLVCPSGYKFRFVFVIDRLDVASGTVYTVTDYKTVVNPISPDELKDKLQARVYALAVQIAHKDATEIWVEFDLLRYERVGIKFTRDDNVETWRYMQRLGERILNSDGTEEVLNQDCRYCIRRHACKTLQRHMTNDGPLSITDPAEAADKLADLDSAMKAIKKMQDDLEPIVLHYCEEHEVFEFNTDHNKVKITASSRREVDAGRVTELLGPERVAAGAKVNIGVVDDWIKSPDLTDEEKSALKQLVYKKFGNPSVKTSPLPVDK